VDAVRALIAEAGIAVSARAEQVPPEDYLRLAELLARHAY
jgi:16S rRNA A1518/A1519 N6-dimethyltransferase RsmA/KsgA/DIM1 with predicted DNA glycosylase/AP lyase activity